MGNWTVFASFRAAHGLVGVFMFNMFDAYVPRLEAFTLGMLILQWGVDTPVVLVNILLELAFAVELGLFFKLALRYSLFLTYSCVEFALNVHRNITVRQLVQNGDLSESNRNQYQMRPFCFGVNCSPNFTLITHFQVDGPWLEFFNATALESHFYAAHLLIWICACDSTRRGQCNTFLKYFAFKSDTRTASVRAQTSIWTVNNALVKWHDRRS